MKADVLERLRSLNHEFYQTFAGHFADKRRRLQPGVLRALAGMDTSGRILDLGCGHGVLAQRLIEDSFQGSYLGLDMNRTMIDHARRVAKHPAVDFLQVDLSQAGWDAALAPINQTFQPPYSCALMFATLHHIPGSDRRRALVDEVAAMLEAGGRWIVSVWDFMQSERLRQRILPWDDFAIDPGQVEPGDTLIDWRHGGEGVRYVHHFTPQSLSMLAEAAGFDIIASYHMDGENSRLGLYQEWKKV